PAAPQAAPAADLPPLPPPPDAPMDDDEAEAGEVRAPDDSMTGMALIQRELGGTVIREIDTR
ncbi:hypothetical protein, partial [Actinocorallia lasiicapitis]